MKILFVSETYYPHINGVYYFIYGIGSLLIQKGHKVEVITPSDSIYPYRKIINGIHVNGLPSLPIWFYPSVRYPLHTFLRSRIRRIISRFKPDIIHIQDHFWVSKMVVKVNRDLKIPIIGTNHFMPENITVFFKNQRFKKWLESRLWKDFSMVFNEVSLVTTPTETGVHLIRRRLKVDTVAISSGINLEAFNPPDNPVNIRAKYGIPDKPVLLYVGRLDPEKRIEEIIHSVVLAVKKIDFCLVVVGKGTSRITLEKLTEESGITDRVVFTGFVPDDELPYFYKISRCFIIASIAELLSLVTLQAMAAGVPVIAVNAGALRELVINGENGYLYEEGDIPSVVSHIAEIFSDDDLYQKMSGKSREIARLHDINKTLETFERLYNECLSFSKVSVN